MGTSQELLCRWQLLGAALGRGTADWDAAGIRLLRSWRRWPRAYHDTTHLAACLHHLDTVQALQPAPLHDAQAVAMALWFHDAIYWPWSPRNEERSAEWARRFLTAQQLPPAWVATVVQHILATRHGPGTPPPGDAAWLVDIDLAILGQNTSTYQAFERHVRREYFFVRRARYVAGRSAVLQSFLDRPCIYATEWFRNRYEAQARRNLVWALEALRSGQQPGQPPRS